MVPILKVHRCWFLEQKRVGGVPFSMDQVTTMVMEVSGIYSIPLWLISFTFVAVMLGAEELGYRVAVHCQFRLAVGPLGRQAVPDGVGAEIELVGDAE